MGYYRDSFCYCDPFYYCDWFRAFFSRCLLCSDSKFEVLYSKKGQTADQVIERVSHLMKPYGEVMAVTNDYAERETVISLGSSACSCENFIRMIDENVGGMQVNLKELNARERKGYRRPR